MTRHPAWQRLVAVLAIAVLAAAALATAALVAITWAVLVSHPMRTAAAAAEASMAPERIWSPGACAADVQGARHSKGYTVTVVSNPCAVKIRVAASFYCPDGRGGPYVSAGHSREYGDQVADAGQHSTVNGSLSCMITMAGWQQLDGNGQWQHRQWQYVGRG